jgi:diguanylate cyclase (GGDEF)-like protein
MQITAESLLPPSVRACDEEPIHVPGSIQPHGALLLFDPTSDTLVNWAGDLDRLLGKTPHAGMATTELLGSPLQQLVGPNMLVAGDEPFNGRCLSPANGKRVSLMLHQTGHLVAIELEPAEEETSAAMALERVRRISALIGSAETIDAACHRAAHEVQKITGYEHVMVYRFHDDHSGAVVAEALGGEAPSYLHHRFPASDIPAQARELYRRSLIRVIPDVSYTPVPLQPIADASLTDMSHCGLRSVSPVHIKYLQNMGVGASMSVSLLVGGELWGLLACHDSSARMVPVEAQLLCRHVGTTLSAVIQRERLAEEARRTAFHSSALEQILHDLRSSKDPEGALRSSADALWHLVDSGGFALMSRGEFVVGAGRHPTAETWRQLGPYVDAALASRASFSTEQLGEEVGRPPEAVAIASGVLAIRIEGARPLLAVWTRPEQEEEVRWAGNPLLKDGADDPLKALTPRRSFATWREVVRGRSRAWTWEEKHLVEVFKARTEFMLQRHRLERLNKKLAEANGHLNALATTDPLTGLSNRRQFDERMRTEWARCLRKGQGLAVIAIDVDNFKKYNDRFGHIAGDECLKQVAQALRSACRTEDVAARMGGEEFALLLPEIDQGGALAAAERVRLVVEQLGIDHPLNVGGVVTISLGLAEGAPADWGDSASLLKAADEALYEAKAHGRNRFAVRARS